MTYMMQLVIAELELESETPVYFPAPYSAVLSKNNIIVILVLF